MHPVERLRSVIRWSGDESALAVEAAGALASLATEPAGLVVACRRVLAHHPGSGPLWWLTARLLGSSDPRAAASEAAALLDGDTTSERLEACLPLLDEPIAVIGWPAPIARSLSTRPDLARVAVRVAGADPGPALRRRSAHDIEVTAVDPSQLVALRPGLVLLPAAAVGAGRALVPLGTSGALDAAGARAEVWAVGGVGRALPARLFEAAEAAVAAASCDDPPLETLALRQVDRVVGPRGPEHPDDAERAADCPVPPELLRPLTS